LGRSDSGAAAALVHLAMLAKLGKTLASGNCETTAT
jgi:hypothetical protein